MRYINPRLTLTLTLLTVSAGAATGADTVIGYISKPLRVVNGQSVGPAAVCWELGTSRNHFELLTVNLWGRQRYVGAGSGRLLMNWDISKPFRVVNGHLSTSRDLDNSNTRLLDVPRSSVSIDRSVDVISC